MREDVLVLPPSGERRKVGFCLSKKHEAVFNISRKCVAPDVITYVKRSAHVVGSRKPVEKVNASEGLAEEIWETDILRGQDDSTDPLMGSEKHERIEGEVFSKQLMESSVSLSDEQTQKESLQGATTLQWGSLKRSRCSRGSNDQPEHCNLVDELLKSSSTVARKRDHPCSPPAIAAEHVDLERHCKREKRPRNYDSIQGKRGVTERGGKRASLQASQQTHEQELLPITRSSLGKTSASSDIQPTALTDRLEAGPARKDFALPRFVIALSRKEVEEDFLILKGSKLSKRPKRRPRAAEKALLYSTPGNWLSGVSYARYNVREKKSVKQNPKGLKGMKSIDTDSD